MNTFEAFELPEELIYCLEEAGLAIPQQVHRTIIPHILEGADIFISAPQERSATQSVIIPLIAKIIRTRMQGKVIIATATQEEAFKIENEAGKLFRLSGIKFHCLSRDVERVSTDYAIFENKKSHPHFLIAPASACLHFINAAGFDTHEVEAIVAWASPGGFDHQQNSALMEIVAKLKPDCQRIIFSPAETDETFGSLNEFLRTPSIVLAGGNRTNSGYESQQKTQIAKNILHKIYMFDHSASFDGITRIILKEKLKENLVILSRKIPEDEFIKKLRDEIEDCPIFSLTRFNRLKSKPSSFIVVAPAELSIHKIPGTFNSITICCLGEFAKAYIDIARKLKGQRGDSIISIAGYHELGDLYYIKAQYGFEMIQLSPPSDQEIQSEKEANIIRDIEQIADQPSQQELSLLRRIKTCDNPEKILCHLINFYLQHKKKERIVESKKTQHHITEHDRGAEGYRPRQTRPPRKQYRKQRTSPHLVELKLNAGRKDGLDAGFIMQWLQSRLALRSSQFGPIKVTGNSSSIFVPQDRVSDAVLMLSGLQFGGKLLQVEVVGESAKKQET